LSNALPVGVFKEEVVAVAVAVAAVCEVGNDQKKGTKQGYGFSLSLAGELGRTVQAEQNDEHERSLVVLDRSCAHRWQLAVTG
jgi:hypothetical protein